MAHSRSCFQRRVLLLTYRCTCGTFSPCIISVHPLLLLLSILLSPILGDTLNVPLGNHRSRRVRSHPHGWWSRLVLWTLDRWVSQRHDRLDSYQPQIHRLQLADLGIHIFLPTIPCPHRHGEEWAPSASDCRSRHVKLLPTDLTFVSIDFVFCASLPLQPEFPHL